MKNIIILVDRNIKNVPKCSRKNNSGDKKFKIRLLWRIELFFERTVWQIPILQEARQKKQPHTVLFSIGNCGRMDP